MKNHVTVAIIQMVTVNAINMACSCTNKKVALTEPKKITIEELLKTDNNIIEKSDEIVEKVNTVNNIKKNSVIDKIKNFLT